MAKMDIKMNDDGFLVRLSKLAEKTDDVAKLALKEGAQVVYAKVKSNLASVSGKGTKYPSRSTGELINALGISPVKVDKNGNYNIKIGFAEPRKNKYKAKKKRSYYNITNAMLANILEYGKSGQPPKPFLKSAVRATQNSCMQTIKAKFDSIVKEK